MTDGYAAASDSLARTIGAAHGQSSGLVDDVEYITIDQQLKVAEIAALLSFAQEISSFNPNNAYSFRDSKKDQRPGAEIEQGDQAARYDQQGE